MGYYGWEYDPCPICKKNHRPVGFFAAGNHENRDHHKSSSSTGVRNTNNIFKDLKNDEDEEYKEEEDSDEGPYFSSFIMTLLTR